ncbi:cobalt-precorrin-5B (C(1))-methyltransferase [Leucothrix arctica]|uniref:Cobalt-precorrin-5B C(1)-methyltransferase n=1 Tax=Leucothrix arctica TaxID=1481894 RepID=A0A317CAY7_9GAMM|nr:cobalt-precorrin-5B (C(1))-methyltransferase [Leucothrix arctica]PWQ95529.1 cobalt-precorrin-5B (C(1))-methyltransferase [Leucothrix arctica]
MKPETDEQARPLRTGLTTGSCATACSVAAAHYLFADVKSESVEITLPKGKLVNMPITALSKAGNSATASTIKDGGDDPDATHGATLSVCITLVDLNEASSLAQEDLPTGKVAHSKSAIQEPEVQPDTSNLSPVIFKAGEGVGTATREGLVIPVGQPAINPVPRKMIREHLRELASQYEYNGGFEVTVSVADGVNIALKTMNGRLGILGGISILGTTGIVRPFSCAAYIASIHQGIDVARANGEDHISACTGNSSETFIQSQYDLPDMAMIEMGDFVGAVLKYLRHNSVTKLSICGGFGKLSKLANGHLDLHSRVSTINFDYLADCAVSLGASDALIQQIKSSNTSIEALKHCQANNIDLAGKVCEDALTVAKKTIKQDISVEVWAVNRAGEKVGFAQ